MFYDSIFLKKQNAKWITMRPVIWKSNDLIVIPKGFKASLLKTPKWIWWEIRSALVLREYLESDNSLNRQCKDEIFKKAVGNISFWKKFIIWKELKLLPTLLLVPYIEKKFRRICYGILGRRIVVRQFMVALFIMFPLGLS